MKSLQSQSISIVALLLFLLSVNVLKLADANPFLPKHVAIPLVFRGGSTRVLNHEQDDDDDDLHQQEQDEEDPEVQKKRSILRKYHMEQQMLMQVRSTILSEALAKRGLPMITIMDVATAEGDKPPDIVDWDCAMSTQDEPKVCTNNCCGTFESRSIGVGTRNYSLRVPFLLHVTSCSFLTHQPFYPRC
jgi:hypothetical protein